MFHSAPIITQTPCLGKENPIIAAKIRNFFARFSELWKLWKRLTIAISPTPFYSDSIGEKHAEIHSKTEEKMRKIKQILASMLAICALSTAVACGNNQETNSTVPDASVGDSVSTEQGSAETPNDGASDSGSAPSNGENSNSGNSSDSGTSNTPTDSSPEAEPTPPKPTTQQYVRCTGNNVNLRSGAGTGFTILGQAEEGTMYVVTGKYGNWYQTYYRGKTAYIYTEYATVFTLPLSQNEEAEDVIEEAYKHIGVPYVYGAVRLHDGKGNLLKGFTAQKFDCSSLVQYVYYQAAGTLLDTTTRTQVKQGKAVKRADLQRGDCIYFTNETRQHLTGIERVGHVAIYLGNNYILHTASDYARIEKMSATRWSYYIEARRFV